MTLLAPPKIDTKTDAPRARRKWRQYETEAAVRWIAAGLPIEEVAVRLGRTVDGVRWHFSHDLKIRPTRIRIR